MGILLHPATFYLTTHPSPAKGQLVEVCRVKQVHCGVWGSSHFAPILAGMILVAQDSAQLLYPLWSLL